MKQPIDLSSDSNMIEFANATSEVFSSTLGAVLNVPVNLNVTEVYSSTPDAFLAEPFGKAIVRGVESNNSFEAGFLFNTSDVTSLVDLMLMGEGVPSDTIDAESVDAIKEFSTQMLAALSRSVFDRIGIDSNMSAFDVSEVTEADILPNNSYCVFTISGNRGGVPLDFSYYMCSNLHNLFSSSAHQAEQQLPEEEISQPGTQRHASGSNLDMLLDVDLSIGVRMGSAKLFLKDILGLGPGNIVELEQNADEPIELTVNNKVIARGEVVIVDGYFGFRIKEIVSKAERIKKLKD